MSTKPPCSCVICHQTFSNVGGFVSHFENKHLKMKEKYRGSQIACSCICCKQELYTSSMNSHYASSHHTNITSCTYCKKWFPVNTTEIFCSSSCSAKHFRRIRSDSGWTMSAESRKKISIKLTRPSKPSKPSKPKTIEAPYSKVYRCTCKFCKVKFVSKNPKQVCSQCQHLKYKNNDDQWSFKFDVFKYPDLFDLDELKRIGWCSFGGKRGKVWNPNGLSRDHKVSVNDAKINGYDPYYITHPMNCELMPMIENNKKKGNSSITYDELIRLVTHYDLHRGGI